MTQAFNFLEKQADLEQLKDNFIGFTIETNPEMILQFVRIDSVKWTLDIPLFRNHKYIGSYSAKIDKDQVFRLVRDFFDDGSILIELMKNQKYEKLRNVLGDDIGAFVEIIDD